MAEANTWTMAIVHATESKYDDIYNYESGFYGAEKEDYFLDKEDAMHSAIGWIQSHPDLVHDLINSRGDLYTSDRELQALGYVLKDLYMVDF